MVKIIKLIYGLHFKSESPLLGLFLFPFVFIFRVKNTVYYEENDGKYPIFRNEYWRVIKAYH